MRQPLFAFLLGAVVGGFGSLIAVGPGGDQDGEAPPLVETPIIKAPVKPRGHAQPLDADADDPSLAAALDRARFDQDWERVTDVARVLRTRAVTGKTASPSREPVAEDEQGSLTLASHRYQRRAFWTELRQRDNAATQVAESELDAPEKAQRLTDLLLAPVVLPTDRVVREDAATLLADLKIESGRVALLRAVKEPDPELAGLAAVALCRADDVRAIEALQNVLRSDPNSALRARVAQALAFSTGTAAGGGPAEVLAQVAEHDSDLVVRAGAVRSLARADLEACPTALEALIAMTGDAAEDLSLRRECVKALKTHWDVARRLPGQLVLAVEQAVPQATGALRTDMVELLGSVGRAESLEILEALSVTPQGAGDALALREAMERLRVRAQER